MTSPIDLHTRFSPRVNLALQHNAVPVIHELSLRNQGEADLHDLRLQLKAEPPFIRSREWAIDHLAAEAGLQLADLKLVLDRAYLAQLTEAVRGELHFSLTDVQGEVLLDERHEVEILARDEWGGLGELPEIIAAFIQPNHPAVESLLRDTGEVLRQSGLPDGLEGYQSGSPRRVGQLIAALWSAVAAQGLHYAVPPASFEERGQKVRNPGRILEHKLATCLDSSLLFAACLEQMGLHPLVIFLKGHAFVGCWLQPLDFSHAVIGDAQSLRKRVRLHELLVFETTRVTDTPPASFSRACEQGEERLADDAGFVLAVDVQRARMAGIRPLPHGAAQEEITEAEAAEPAPRLDLPPDLPDHLDSPPAAPPPSLDTPDARVEHWKRKLLDLSLRNKLLNFRFTRLALRLHCPEPALLEDRLADGKRFRILPMPELEGAGRLRSQRLYEDQSGQKLYDDYARRALNKNELLVAQSKESLETALLELYRASRNALEESGSNVLHLALGFLHWTPKNRPDKIALAPLILIPVSLQRRSVRSGFRLGLHEDEARFNPTLLQLLRQDYGLRIPALEDELPSDEHGLDVVGIWNELRRQIRDIPGWEVREDVVLSTFSFAKYLMWQDLVARTEQLKENTLVRHLIDTPRQPYPPQEDFPSASELDSRWPPAQTFNPLLADSSQRVAIRAAAQGQDFVLVGPPGTGKSQTIANLIAQCMAEGKSVLFVSEKTAALEVVFRRLHESGLGDHCLELHSHKARKLDVLKQLERAWNSRARLDEQSWQQLAEQLEAKRVALNDYVARLHHVHENGLSLYQALGETLLHRAVPHLNLHWEDPLAHDQAALQAMRSVSERMALADEQLGGIKNHPLQHIHQTHWSPAWQRGLLEKAAELADYARQLQQQARRYLQHWDMPELTLSAARVRALSRLHRQLLASGNGRRAFLIGPKRRRWREELQTLLETLGKYQRAWQGLSVAYADLALQADLPAWQLQWQHSLSAWWGKRWLMQRRVRKALAGVTQQGRAPEDVGGDLQRLVQAKKYAAALEQHKELIQLLGKDWQGVTTDTGLIKKLLQWSGDASRQIRLLEEAGAQGLREQLLQRLKDQPDLLAKGAALEQAGAALMQAHEQFQQALEQTAQQAATPAQILLAPDAPQGLDALRQHCQQWQAHARQLKYWCAWQALRAEAQTLGLAPLADYLQQQGQAHDLAQLFQVNYCRWWVEAMSERDDLLPRFVPSEHEYLIERFRALDDELTALSARAIRARLCARLPDKSDVKRNSAWGLLARELQKKRRHKPLRQLLSALGEELPRLTPCVMMSPLSIAQYLPADAARFDVVVFDEASQIPTWDAIGAIARGRQAVIVGDPKQLPPTAFFQRADNEEFDDELEVDELESILDECLGANVPAIHLSWHYRSRDESLIAFSNHHYYEGKLVTFPGPIAGDSMVRYRHVPEGVYEKGASRTNPGEARAIVAAMVKWLRQPDFSDSLGVVTFNMEQQVLIQNLLEQARAQYPEIEPHFAEDAYEPVFVKNLESVQGDERDIILFSITYGPDQQGRVSMNFGPLNRAGGQRRLNVAITRARKAMWVFATLQAGQIDLGRTQAQGVADLKHFLEYAEKGPAALPETDESTEASRLSAFEQAVSQALQARGWQVHGRVGVSRLRIDLAVVHPDDAEQYLAAIECDGPGYRQAATARDRDKLRELVLRRLGWELLRVWSPDWWTDPEGAAERLHEHLSGLLEQSRQARQAAMPEPLALPPPPA